MGYAEGCIRGSRLGIIGGKHDRAEYRERQTGYLGNVDARAQSGGGLYNMRQNTKIMEETLKEKVEEAKEVVHTDFKIRTHISSIEKGKFKPIFTKIQRFKFMH